MVGDVSSSDAVAICVASAGFHAIALHLDFLVGSLNVMTGFFARKSHTTETPLYEAEAKMCCTFLFHCKQVISVCC